MNTKYIISALLLGALTFTSCDDFLDMQPSNSANASTAITSADDALTALNGVLSAMNSTTYYGRNMFMYADAKGGDLTIFSQGRGLDGFYSFNHTPTSGTYSGFWSRGFYCIMQLNNIIENIEKLEEEGQTGFDLYKGEAYTLRALVYFDLVRLYGLPYNYNKGAYGVPDITTTLSADALPLRATVEQNYSRIVSDLAIGEQALSSSKKALNKYPGYYANKALQARVYLYMEDYSKALSAAKTVIESGVYKLYSNSEWVASWSKQFGSESIFELGIDSVDDNGTGSLGFYLIQYGIAKNAMGWFLASDYFLNRLGEDPTDVRWGVMGLDETAVDDPSSTRMGSCYKYVGGTTAMTGDGKETATAVNIKIIRLSEMYLIASEAALQNGDKKAAADYLNEIRKRSAGLAPATESTISIQMILDERSKELFGEGHRFFDMIRLNQTIEFNDDFQDVPVTQRGKKIDRTYGKIVLPIDQDEINVNPEMAAQQNDGYKA
ncbi:MAG: RagB/SusD family nutrient uptake outer membrane protein [Bacteroidales bacterium]|nr:RagB/SusD family nutrient uptake outer membrane protein [Bacteroidales bacterium]